MQLPRLMRTLTVPGLCFMTGVQLLTASPAAAAVSAVAVYEKPLRTAVRELPIAAENNASYDRDTQFGDWRDADSDCHDTRSEVLITESRVTASGGCVINWGDWLSRWDGQRHTAASDVDIDHHVPVAEAWGSGARAWTQTRRVAFYNDLGDPRSLNAMTDNLNSSKSAYGPEDWMPPARKCQYVTWWVAVKIRWSLTVDSRERTALLQWADACPNVTVRVRKA